MSNHYTIEQFLNHFYSPHQLSDAAFKSHMEGSLSCVINNYQESFDDEDIGLSFHNNFDGTFSVAD